MTIQYCTLNDARTQLTVGESRVDASADAILHNGIMQTSKRLDNLLGWQFEPVIKDVFYPLDGHGIVSDLRILRVKPVLELTSVKVYATTLTAGTDVQGYPPDATAPYWDLQLISTSGDWYSTYYSSTASAVVKVTGQHGYHDDYGNAWRAVDAVADVVGINATVTSVEVADADGSDWRGLTPRFSPGNLIKIGTEFMRVTAVDTTTNILTVVRGENGSTAAVHSNADVIYDWAWPEDIRLAVARQAALFYKRRGVWESAASPLGVGQGQPVDLTADLYRTVGEYTNYG